MTRTGIHTWPRPNLEKDMSTTFLHALAADSRHPVPAHVDPPTID